MAKETSELVARLCTVAGTIMEDVSPIALIGVADTSNIETVISAVRHAGEDIAVLARAAEIVARRG